METSALGISLIEQREDKRNTAYQDSRGIWTIGVGHTGAEVVEGLVWTDEQVAAQLAANLKGVEDEINATVTVLLEQYEFDALVSFGFNVGEDAERHSTLMRFINENDKADVPAQFDRWHIPPEVASRRNGEREQFKGTRFEARIA